MDAMKAEGLVSSEEQAEMEALDRKGVQDAQEKLAQLMNKALSKMSQEEHVLEGAFRKMAEGGGASSGVASRKI